MNDDSFEAILPNKHHVAVGMASVAVPRPTVGRIVHFYEAPSDDEVRGPYAAIVTAVGDGVPPSVRLSAFIPTKGMIEVLDVGNLYDNAAVEAGLWWAWPPREG